jgi:AcrR family transcriptional regulator
MTTNQDLDIRRLYIDYINSNGRKPTTVASFCKDANIAEVAFYEHFASLHSLEGNILSGFISTTMERLQNDDTYINYTIREKLLAFYYTLLEELKNERSFVSSYFSHANWSKTAGMSQLKKVWKEYLKTLVDDGLESGEIPNRFNLHKIYADAGYLQGISIVHFWVHDHSDQMEKTDGFIERSVNFSMDLITRNGLDSGFELGKFLFQQIKK